MEIQFVFFLDAQFSCTDHQNGDVSFMKCQGSTSCVDILEQKTWFPGNMSFNSIHWIADITSISGWERAEIERWARDLGWGSVWITVGKTMP